VAESAPRLKAEVCQAFTAAAPRYDTSGAQFFRPIGERLVHLAGLEPGQHVLDIGCGAGAVLIPAARAAGPHGHVTGIDLSPAMAARAAREAAHRNLAQVTIQVADAEDPPFPPASFDAVLASLVLYLLPAPQAALLRWRDLLRPGGRAGFTWGMRPDPRWAPVFDTVDRYAPPGLGLEAMTRRLGPAAEVEAMLTRCGYTTITTTSESIEVTYDSPEQWWQASWHELPRLAWQHIPKDLHQAARRDAFAELDKIRGPGGTLTRRILIGYMLARLDERRQRFPASAAISRGKPVPLAAADRPGDGHERAAVSGDGDE
jgi:SAM-dependent methyltransferase